ncbi:MAG: GntR family transcriptional regulator [Candidatus Omnitrophica bacterium]|nr:GntR family transcriptional regulator [Candidatus Omnitrophota bacterium]
MVANAIKKQIKTGELLPGDPLVSERALSALYNVSLVSVRRALLRLEREGIIEKKWGLGNFVRGTVDGKEHIGVIVPHLRNAIFVEFLREIILQAGERGYHVVVADADNKVEQEKMFISSFAERGIRNVLKFPNIISQEEKIRREMMRLGINFVIINDFWTDLPSTQVRVDENYGTSLIMEHLFSLGHQNIAYLDDGKELRGKIYSCYKKYLEEKGWYRNDFVYLGTPEGVALSRGVQFLLEKKGILTACITPYDCFAIYFLENLVKRCHYAIPDDLAICGFDGVSEAGKPDISLTTVRQPRERIVSEALELLLRKRGNDDASVTVEIKPELVVRKSTDGRFVPDREEVKQAVRNIERRWTI